VRLIAAQFVKPFVKSNKNDFVDAEAVAEAVERRNMRFVPIKTDDQLDLQAIHRVRDRLISRRTAVINQVRAFLLEQSMVFAQKPAKLKAAMADVLENAEAALTSQMRNLIDLLWGEWKMVEQQIEELSMQLERISASDAGWTASARSQASGRSWPPPSSQPSATDLLSVGGASSLHGSASCRGSTQPEARPGCSASASEGTSICARF
jgi:transposase